MGKKIINVKHFKYFTPTDKGEVGGKRVIPYLKDGGMITINYEDFALLIDAGNHMYNKMSEEIVN